MYQRVVHEYAKRKSLPFLVAFDTLYREWPNGIFLPVEKKYCLLEDRALFVQQVLQILESQFMPESRNQAIDIKGAHGDRRSISRRSFLAGSLAATTSAGWIARSASGGTPFGLEVLGKVRARPASSIADSPLGVGFETLDRKMFEPEPTYPFLAELGAKWARVQTGWCRCEPAKGKYDFTWLDAIVDRLLALGIQPWFNLGYGNQLYTPEATNQFAVGWAPLWNDEARQAWLRFVRALAENFRDRVKHWEIWNEPNHRNFWKPHEADPC